jgi:hypothetical protein
MMRSFFKKCGAYALGAACLAGAAHAQDYRYPSMLPGYAAPPSYAATRVADHRSVMSQNPVEGPSLPAPTPYAETIMPGQAGAPAMNGYGYENGVVYGSPEGDAMHDGGCTECGDCCTPCHQWCWFGGVRVLGMTLESQDEHWFSYDDINLENQILNHEDADMDWAGGVEASIGRYFNCCQNGIELVYWGLYPDSSEASVTAADVQGTLNHVFTFNSLSYDDGLGGGVAALDDWFNDAQIHRVRRDWEFHNVEVNLLTFRNGFMGGCGCGPSIPSGCWDSCQPRVNLSFLAGFRFFRFDEYLQFASDNSETVFDGDPDEVYYDVDVDNELYGIQIGGEAELFVTRRLSFSAGTKFGVFENNMEQRQLIAGANGAAVVNDPISPNFGQAYDITSSEEDVAVLGELETGVNVYLLHNLRATAGYRVLAISGVARTTDQIPYNFDDILGAREINTEGSMVLHGGYAGLEFNY